MTVFWLLGNFPRSSFNIYLEGKPTVQTPLVANFLSQQTRSILLNLGPLLFLQCFLFIRLPSITQYVHPIHGFYLLLIQRCL